MRLLIPIFYGVTRQVLSDLCVYQSTISITIQPRVKLELIVENGPQEVNMADWTGSLALELVRAHRTSRSQLSFPYH